MKSPSPIERLSDELDKSLLDVLVNGREIMTQDGPVRMQASAADLNVVRQRLKDAGIAAIATEENPIGSLIREMQLRGVKIQPQLPPIDMDITREETVRNLRSNGFEG